jgi:hypothetical protein
MLQATILVYMHKILHASSKKTTYYVTNPFGWNYRILLKSMMGHYKSTHSIIKPNILKAVKSYIPDL